MTKPQNKLSLEITKNELFYNKMLEITNELMKNSFSVFFLEPFIPNDKQLLREYKSKVKNPMDLGTIKQNIINKKYNNSKDWINDINLVFDNAISFNLEQSLVGSIALHLKNQFNKKIELFILSNPKNLENKLFDLTNELNCLISNPPIDFEFNNKEELIILNSNEFTNEKIHLLMNSLNEKCKKGESSKILNIINNCSFDKKYESLDPINLSHLNRSILNELNKFVNEN